MPVQKDITPRTRRKTSLGLGPRRETFIWEMYCHLVSVHQTTSLGHLSSGQWPFWIFYVISCAAVTNARLGLKCQRCMVGKKGIEIGWFLKLQAASKRDWAFLPDVTGVKLSSYNNQCASLSPEIKVTVTNACVVGLSLLLCVRLFPDKFFPEVKAIHYHCANDEAIVPIGTQGGEHYHEIWARKYTGDLTVTGRYVKTKWLNVAF